MLLPTNTGETLTTKKTKRSIHRIEQKKYPDELTSG